MLFIKQIKLCFLSFSLLTYLPAANASCLRSALLGEIQRLRAENARLVDSAADNLLAQGRIQSLYKVERSLRAYIATTQEEKTVLVFEKKYLSQQVEDLLGERLRLGLDSGLVRRQLDACRQEKVRLEKLICLQQVEIARLRASLKHPDALKPTLVSSDLSNHRAPGFGSKCLGYY